MKNWLARKFLITAMVAVILAGGVGFWLHTRKDHKVAFQTATLKRGDLVSTISANGTIEPIEVIDVGAQVAGLINSFGKDHDGKTIDYGSVIDADTVLAQIDDSVYAADVSLARAQVEQDVAGEVRAAAEAGPPWLRRISPRRDRTRGRARFERGLQCTFRTGCGT